MSFRPTTEPAHEHSSTSGEPGLFQFHAVHFGTTTQQSSAIFSFGHSTATPQPFVDTSSSASHHSQRVTASQHPKPTKSQPTTPTREHQELNTASVCALGSMTVQEIVNRTREMFEVLKNLPLPNGTSASQKTCQEMKVKIQEQLKGIRVLFRNLRMMYDKCEVIQYDAESLIRYVEVTTRIQGQEKTKQSVIREKLMLVEQLEERNRELKKIIDILRKTIWDINIMLEMKGNGQ